MKYFIKNLYIIFALFYGVQIYSQARYCKEVFNPNLQISNTTPLNFNPALTNSTNAANDPDAIAYPEYDPTRRYVYRLHFNIFRDDNGVRANGNVGEAEVMNIVKDLNLNYNQFKIFFKYIGFDYVDDTSLTGDVLFDDLLSNYGWMLNNHAFHINILDGNITDYNQSGNLVTIPGIGFFLSTLVFLSHDAVNSARITSHEVGHCLYLYHDYRNYGDPFDSEFVVRDPYEPGNGYNSNNYGDRVHGTPATRIWAEDQYDTQGIYIGGDIDYNTSLPSTHINRYFKTESPRKNNIMHVHDGPDYSIGYVFEPGQGKRIRWNIANDILQNYGIWNLAEIDWEELYQPFETRFIGGDVVLSVTENPNDTGTALVCRNLLHIDRFQKGFDMKFENLDGTLFASSNPNELMEIERTSSYFTRVIQFKPDILQTVNVDYSRGMVCEEEPYVGGIVFSTEILG